jgi:hypothetical protein
LSDGDPAPPAARDFSAAVNKEWDERSVTAPSPREGNENQATSLSAREKEPDALVVMPGPGGFPLLGAVAIGHRGRNPATDLGDYSKPRVVRELDRELADRALAEEFLASSDVAVAEGRDEAQSGGLTARGWGGFRVSVFSGLGVATVFTLNAVLSQPIAGFDYLTRRMDAGGGPLVFRTGRRRKPAAGPHGSSNFDDSRR